LGIQPHSKIFLVLILHKLASKYES
jgi:hypothetical protein